MPSLLADLQAMARSLFEDKDVYVRAWHEPAHHNTEEQLTKAEEKLGSKLPDELRSLYLKMDGFGIVWVHRDDFENARSVLQIGIPKALNLEKAKFEKLRQYSTKKWVGRMQLPWTTKVHESTFEMMANVGQLDHKVTGLLRIPPLKHFMTHPEYAAIVKGLKDNAPKATQSLDGQELLSHQLCGRFHVLDAYSASEQSFLYAGPGPRQMRVHRMSSYYKFYESTPHLSLEDYFRRVIKGRGRVDARQPLFPASQ